jgi:hypothetical protein
MFIVKLGGDHCEDVHVDGRTPLKWNSYNKVVDWISLIQCKGPGMARSSLFGRFCPITFHRYVLIHRNAANIFRIKILITLTKGINGSFL